MTISAPSPIEWPHACACCGASYTEREWSALTYVGKMKDEVDALELRNCPCGSTLAQVIPKSIRPPWMRLGETGAEALAREFAFAIEDEHKR